MNITWRTAWQGQDIVVYRDDAEVDRLHAADIERVLLLHRGSGDSPSDLVQVVVEIGADLFVFLPDTGFAGRVHFERQAFWTEQGCVYWVNEARAPLPLPMRRSRWLPGFGAPAFMRVARAELEAVIARWPLQGPQTWEQRKWRRIERARPFAPRDGSRLRA